MGCASVFLPIGSHINYRWRGHEWLWPDIIGDTLQDAEFSHAAMGGERGTVRALLLLHKKCEDTHGIRALDTLPLD